MAKPSLMECLDTFMAQADTLLDGVVEGLALSARGAVGLSAVGFDSHQLRPLVEAVLADRAAVKERFKKTLHKGMYEGPGVDPGQGRAVTFEELKFFEEDQLDSSIELARISEDLERCVSDVLPATHALMSAMLGWVSVQPQLNPVRPEVYARALRDGLMPCLDAVSQSGVAGREQLLTAAAGYMGMALAKMYKQNMDWLKSTGLEPAGMNLTDVPSVGSKAGEPESQLAKTLLTLDRLRKLLTGQVDGDQPHLSSLVGSVGGRDFLHTVPASMAALQDMQQVDALVSRLSKKAKEGPANAKEAAKQKALAVELRLGKQLGKHLGTEVIRLMVENLTQDERLLSPIRQLLQQLEPQLIALGNKDQRFFADREHAARKLIDSITHRSLAFSAADDFGFAEFYQSVKLVLGSLSQPTDDVIAAFLAAQALLAATWQQQDEASRLRDAEVAKSLLHIEQRNLLAQHISAAFRSKLGTSKLPSSVLVFLCGPWAQVLAERKIQTTPPSARFDDLADNLVWSAQTHRAKKNPARLVQMVPVIVRTMREGLRTIDYPDEMTKEFFDELIGLHEAALEGANRNAGPTSDEEETVVAVRSTPIGDGFWVAGKESAESGFLAAGSTAPTDDEAGDTTPVFDPLPLGTWVDLQLEGRSIRANLRWTSPYQNLYLFVGNDGLQHSMTRKSLDKLRASGQVRVVAQGGVVTAALDRVADLALKNSAKHAPNLADTAPQTDTPTPT